MDWLVQKYFFDADSKESEKLFQIFWIQKMSIENNYISSENKEIFESQLKMGGFSESLSSYLASDIEWFSLDFIFRFDVRPSGFFENKKNIFRSFCSLYDFDFHMTDFDPKW